VKGQGPPPINASMARALVERLTALAAEQRALEYLLVA
jgi:hypothetical protein